MTMQKFAVIILLSQFTLNLSAQNSDPSKASAGKATVVHTAEINAVAKMITGFAVADSVLRVVSIEMKYNIGVSEVSPSKINGKKPPDAIVHDVVTEVYHIVEGRGTLLLGGTLDSAVQFPADGQIVLKMAGPSSAGKHITDGTQ
jgi:mannose-6-phosphate isomerase-like protein (cupin superfamily)